MTFIFNPSPDLYSISSELGTLEWDTFDPDGLIRVSNVDTLYWTKTQFFKIIESFPILYLNLKRRAKFKISQLLVRDSEWLNFVHFSGYKYMLRLVSRLRKKGDQVLISISTNLKLNLKTGFLWSQFRSRVKVDKKPITNIL